MRSHTEAVRILRFHEWLFAPHRDRCHKPQLWTWAVRGFTAARAVEENDLDDTEFKYMLRAYMKLGYKVMKDGEKYYIITGEDHER